MLCYGYTELGKQSSLSVLNVINATGSHSLEGNLIDHSNTIWGRQEIVHPFKDCVS